MGATSRILSAMAQAGELVLLAGVALWMLRLPWVPGVFAAGAVLFAAGRMLGKEGDYAKSYDSSLTPTLRHLYRQRMGGELMAVLAAVLMNLNAGFYWGYYLRPSVWLIPFVVFVVLELYTAFRISSIEKKREG